MRHRYKCLGFFPSIDLFFFLFFFTTVVKDNPTLDMAAIGALLWEKWEELSDEDRDEYVKLGQKEARR